MIATGTSILCGYLFCTKSAPHLITEKSDLLTLQCTELSIAGPGLDSICWLWARLGSCFKHNSPHCCFGFLSVEVESIYPIHPSALLHVSNKSLIWEKHWSSYFYSQLSGSLMNIIETNGVWNLTPANRDKQNNESSIQHGFPWILASCSMKPSHQVNFYASHVTFHWKEFSLLIDVFWTRCLPVCRIKLPESHV